MTKGSPEKREQERVLYLSECVIESDTLGRAQTARINDLNSGGAFIDVMIAFPIGSVFGMKFRLRDTEIRVQAEVRYSMRNIGVGVRFLDLSDEARNLIEHVLHNKPIEPKLAAARAPDARTDEVWPPADNLAVDAPTIAFTNPNLVLADPKAALDGPVPLAKPRPAEARPPLPPPKPAAAPAQSDTVISGNLSILSVFDIINMIQNGGLTGSLVISTPQSTGNIYFNSGRIVDADDAADRGVTALNRLLGATAGTFAFKKSQKPFEETISSASNTALLLEMMVSRENGAGQPRVLIN